MADTREARAHAAEIKIVVDGALGVQIQDWARLNLDPDPYGSGPFGDQYLTTSLYFDTPNRDVFHRRGSFGRAKYRIRRYGQGAHVFLERKLRKPGLLVKRRTKVSIEDLRRLEDDSVTDWGLGNWFRRRVVGRRLEPVCQLSYHRVARGVMSSTGPARLTVDDGIRVAPIDRVGFVSDPGLPVLEGCMIVEMKFRAHMPVQFEALLEQFQVRPQAASKYRHGMAAMSGLSLRDEPEPVELGTDRHV